MRCMHAGSKLGCRILEPKRRTGLDFEFSRVAASSTALSSTALEVY